MHIFNLNKQPYLIISAKELLFRHNSLDENMQRIEFTQIKRISTEHRYNPKKELFVWLSVYTTTKNAPYLIQVSLLNETLEEVFSILQDQLGDKIKFTLPKSTTLVHLRTHNKKYKQLTFIGVLIFLSLFLYHKFVLPSLDSIQTNSSKVTYQKAQGMCSTNVKVAYPTQEKESILVKNYCGLFGFWKEQGSKQIPAQHLETEFNPNSAQDWLLASSNFVKVKNYKKAIVNTQKALYLEPENKEAQVYLSKIYKQDKNHKQAMLIAKQTVKKYKNFALAHENIAYLYQDENNTRAAYTHFKNFNRLDPSASSYMALARIQENQNFKEEALINYEKALVLSANNPVLLTKVGLAYWDEKKFDKAEHTLKKAYTLKPKNSSYFLNYYEISLVTEGLVNSKQKENFLQDHQNNIEQMMVYEMLQIIEASIEGNETLILKKKWNEKYHDQELNWSFLQLRAWLDDSSLEIEHIQDIQSTLGFFIGHQQAYAMRLNDKLERQ